MNQFRKLNRHGDIEKTTKKHYQVPNVKNLDQRDLDDDYYQVTRIVKLKKQIEVLATKLPKSKGRRATKKLLIKVAEYEKLVEQFNDHNNKTNCKEE